MNGSTWKSAIAALSLLIVLSGCGQAKAVKDGDTAQRPASQAQTNQPAEKQVNVKAYYGDDQGMKLVEKSLSVSLKQEQDKYLAALNALTTAPDAALIPLAKGVTFRTVKLDAGKLTVDVKIADEARLGAPGEELLLKALTQTVFQFNEVASIDILVEGKAADSLMGHVDLPHPIKRP